VQGVALNGMAVGRIKALGSPWTTFGWLLTVLISFSRDLA